MEIRANQYDELIKKYVLQLNNQVTQLNNEYKKRDGTYNSNFIDLDWRWVKAMIFVETQGPYSGDAWQETDAWKYDPMQVANSGDWALEIVRQGKENTELLSTQVLRNKLLTIKYTSFKNGNPDYSGYGKLKISEQMTPELSIEIGVIWLFRKAISKVDLVSVPDESKLIYNYTVRNRDSYSLITKKVGTTVVELEIQNGKNRPLKPDQILQYRKATLQKQILSWKNWNQVIQDYNSRAGYYDRVNAYYQRLIKGESCFAASQEVKK